MCYQRLSSIVLSFQAFFPSKSAPNNHDNNNPMQCSPNFPIRCTGSTQKWSIRYNSQDITTVSNKMLGPRKTAHSILATIRTYSNEFTNMSSDEGVFHRFSTRKAGFCPTFRVFVSNGSKSLLWVVATSNSLTQLIPTQKLRN